MFVDLTRRAVAVEFILIEFALMVRFPPFAVRSIFGPEPKANAWLNDVPPSLALIVTFPPPELMLVKVAEPVMLNPTDDVADPFTPAIPLTVKLPLTPPVVNCDPSSINIPTRELLPLDPPVPVTITSPPPEVMVER